MFFLQRHYTDATMTFLPSQRLDNIRVRDLGKDSWLKGRGQDVIGKKKINIELCFFFVAVITCLPVLASQSCWVRENWNSWR